MGVFLTLNKRQMRNIEYRGLRTDGKGWAYGDFFRGNNGYYILNKKSPFLRDNQGLSPFTTLEVRRETIGQSITPDNKGVMIFTGDKIKCKGQMCEVRFDESHCYYALFNIAVGCKVVNLSKNNVGKFEMEVIGNVHQKQTKK